ncbi:tyrosinase family protein [Stigmatella aurantiaca]|uniref:Tyrosinase n=1 Tax=Stigmatella aurantiaca (strain DW4/3-1) TaxID=378806 RepID=Q093B2_STIAD|nr:tyrosinase family protein [Stigmatella aurantiaca]ADO76111.1 Tyrosinase [Stigmatella aurantiaca DW4/3-1]EAU66827.1 tyrosinase [Stigmatella aurantiaca DW4/3-1]
MAFTRREFLVTTSTLAGASMLPFQSARAQSAKYIRYNVTTDKGKEMLKSYAKGIQAMLKLPASDPRNWFRNAFIHFMDCPHGNWWFYVWHRGYVGYVEETIRSLSGDPSFAFPYWDWTELPQIPGEMFDSVLTPADAAYAPYTQDIGTFTSFIQPALEAYWNQLNPTQLQQMAARGYTHFKLLWDGVIGVNPGTGSVDPGDAAFAANARARYLTRDNPKLDPKTAHEVSWDVVGPGLLPVQFYNNDVTLSFTSSKTPSHVTMPGSATQFSVLEGHPHNKVHNYIGGVGPWNPGPFGSMTNFLSPVDPIFFLHHANMDRLWDVWTRKQQRLGLHILPQGKELEQLSNDPFLFFVRSDGTFVLDGKAGDYLSTERFGYTYEEPVTAPAGARLVAAKAEAPAKATLKKGVAALTLPAPVAKAADANAPARPVVATLTVSRPTEPSSPREFDVLVNAPADVTSVDADSPYYGGTVAFFGPPMHGMKHDTTFAVPLSPRLQALSAPASLKGAKGAVKLEIRLAPSTAKDKAPPALKAATLRRL